MSKTMLTADIPEHDLAFEIAVMKRIEQRRHRRGLALNATLGVAAMILLALMMPHITLVGTRDAAAAALMMTALFGLTLSLQWGLMRRT